MPTYQAGTPREGGKAGTAASYYQKSDCCTSIIAIGLIVVGIIYLNQCPKQPMIPIWMIVCGAIPSGGAVLLVITCCCSSTTMLKAKYYFFLLTQLFQFGWLIAGAYWVFSSFKPSSHEFLPSASVTTFSSMKPDVLDLDYCHPAVYWFSFAYIVLYLAIMIICWPILCCAMCFAGGIAALAGAEA